MMKLESVYPRLGWSRGSKLVILAIFVLAGFELGNIARHTENIPSALCSYISTKPQEHYTQHKYEPEWDGYTIKPVAYVFPQFHPIPENDKFWGEGFTEWTNVQKVNTSRFGIEVVHPPEDVGYYNLLDLDVRKRYAKLVRDSGYGPLLPYQLVLLDELPS